ncbi:MAG: tRNA1(Val) (adenine(37)-N6)-methyltransferase [Parasporobacterium sp.]|nr:tRNA1(Val) (adenine(37)-N6)-methyltransferase [Parasporobacterium sp.]
MKIDLKENERIDDLDIKDYKIIQHKEKFCFGMDAVLLSNFVKATKKDRVIDLGTGTGVIPILLEAKEKGGEFVAVEVQEESADMARRSIALNDLSDKIELVCMDLKEASNHFGKAVFDVVTTNPPYMTMNGGLKNPNEAKAIARHEILCTLSDVIKASTNLLKPGGRLFMVHRPNRLPEIFEELKANNMGAKRIQFVYPYAGAKANMLLIEAVRGAKPEFNVMEALIIYNEKGEYTSQVLEIYGK